MATEQQVQQMLDMMQQQMAALTTLQTENAKLRTEVHNNNTSNQCKVKKPDRPTINGGLDDRDWALFMDSWIRYKTMVNLTDLGLTRMELRSACSEDVNKLLFEYVGSTALDTCSENQLLEHIKSVAVKSVHKEVHQVAFNKMIQNPGESVTNYVARLKAKAFLCGFEVTCTDHETPVTISYAEQMVAQRLVAGLSNQEHQRKVLAEASALVTLSDKVNRLHMLETTEESVTMLHKPPPSEASFHRPTPPSEASFHRSTYKKGKSGQKKFSTAIEGKCRWCGRTTHPGGKSMDRVNCPAKDANCSNCRRFGHFKEVCEQSKNAAADSDQQQCSPAIIEQTLPPLLPSTSSVSFSFGTQDFHQGQKHAENT